MAALQVLEEAAQLGFVSPPTGILSDTGSGEQVAIAWNTPYDLTNLEVWLGPADDGSFVVNVLGGESCLRSIQYAVKPVTDCECSELDARHNDIHVGCTERTDRCIPFPVAKGRPAK